MPSVRRNPRSQQAPDGAGRRLPQRWAVILVVAVVAATPAGAVFGLPGAISVFFGTAAAVHAMVE